MRLWNRLLRGLLRLVLGVYVLIALSMLYLRWFPPLTTAVQTQRRVEALLAGDDYRKRYEFVPRERISDHLENAVVAAEDMRFYEHHGFDVQQIRVAIEEARRGEGLRGGSTITQQLVKNLYLTTGGSWLRKGVEATITPLAELILGKERILELYLNVIEWGIEVYGAEAAAQYYYQTSAAELGRDRSARLAAVIPAPRSRMPQRMDWYAGEILRRMRQMGW